MPAYYDDHELRSHIERVIATTRRTIEETRRILRETSARQERFKSEQELEQRAEPPQSDDRR